MADDIIPIRTVPMTDLTETTDELLLACQRARDEVRARFWIARAEAARWRPRPMPEDFDA